MVERALAAPRRGPARVAFDFWDQFTAYERLKELQRYRPASSRRCRTEGKGTRG